MSRIYDSVLMPHVLHSLGIKKVDRVMSMGKMKYNTIAGSGIQMLRRYVFYITSLVNNLNFQSELI